MSMLRERSAPEPSRDFRVATPQTLRRYSRSLTRTIPPPITVAEGERDGARNGEGYERLLVPPGLRERVLRVRGAADGEGGGAELAYAVLNPSWLTCYPAHTHRGDVAFEPDAAAADRTTMRWRVCVRPMRGGEPVVRGLTSLIVPAFARALSRRLDPGAEPEVSYSWES